MQHDGASLPRPRDGDELRPTLLRLVASPNLADKSWVTDQYDRYVLGNTVLAQPEDAGMIRLARGRPTAGIALAVDGNGRYTRLDPYAGAQLALAEAYRNVATTGARPLAVTNCLNFGSPEDPAVMWQFSRGGPRPGRRLPDAGHPGHRRQRQLLQPDRRHRDPAHAGDRRARRHRRRRPPHPAGLPHRRRADLPAGRHPRRVRRVGVGARRARLPRRPAPEGRPGREQLLADVLINASRDGLIDSAHDLSDGGLAQALVEGCLRGDAGARVVLPEGVDPFVALFSESAGRAVVAVPRTEEIRFTDMCTARGLPYARIGVVDVLVRRPRGAGPVQRAAARAARRPGRRRSRAVRVTGIR